MTERTVTTPEGRVPAVDPIDATVPGFEGFELFTHAVGRDFRLSEATTGRAVPSASNGSGTYMTRGLAVGAGLSWLRRTGAPAFRRMIDVCRAKEEQNDGV